MKEQYLSGKEIVLLEVRKNKENLNFEIVCMWEREWERESLILLGVSYKIWCKGAFMMKPWDIIRKGCV